MTDPLPLGSTLGVLGSGQLGRMFAVAARQMRYKVHVFSPDSGSPAGQVANKEFTAPYEDLDAVREFAKTCAAVTIEFENIPAPTAEAVAEICPLRPGAHVLHTIQNRMREKTFVKDSGVPVTPFVAIHSEDEVREAVKTIGLPAVMKTAGFGYDGKGQSKIDTEDDALTAWRELNTDEAILEAFIPFKCEVSVVGVRGVDGSFAHYGPIWNDHANHILDVSMAPAPVSAAIAKEAEEIARTLMEKLDVVGLLCVEFFVTEDEKLLVNELAPRPHNSGHLTIDACFTSQFAQQVRVTAGMDLGDTAMKKPAAMANLLGDLWTNGEPDWNIVGDMHDVSLHLYGKTEARPGRKMGHLTVLADTPEAAAKRVRFARNALTK